MNISTTKAKIKEGSALFKYVCVNGEYRFAEPEHKHMDLVGTDEVAQSAGFCMINEQDVEVDGRSSTLNVESKQIDAENIKKLFNNS